MMRRLLAGITVLLASGAPWLVSTIAQPTTGPAPVISEPSVPSPAASDAKPSAAHSLTAEDVGAWLDGLIPYGIDRGDIAGAEVDVVKNGRVLFERGYGVADVKSRNPVDPARTLFRPGSISKLFTWTAVMQQVEQGHLNLDADVNTYLDFQIPPRDGQPITLRNIMTHTAGFEEQIKTLIGYDRANMPSNED